MRFCLAMSAVFLLIATSMLLAGAVSAYDATRVVPPGASPLVGETREAGRATPVAAASNALRALQDKLPDLAPSKPVSYLTPNEIRLLNAINADRAKYGRPPLTPDPILMRCARDRSQIMRHENAHCPNGEWPQAAARRYGFRGPVNENFAPPWNPPWTSGEEVVYGWSQSSGHARCMRESRWNVIGVGVWRGTGYVAMFGQK